MEFTRQEYWSGLPFPSSGDLLDPGIKPGSLTLQADSLPSGSPVTPNCETPLQSKETRLSAIWNTHCLSTTSERTDCTGYLRSNKPLMDLVLSTHFFNKWSHAGGQKFQTTGHRDFWLIWFSNNGWKSKTNEVEVAFFGYSKFPPNSFIINSYFPQGENIFLIIFNCDIFQLSEVKQYCFQSFGKHVNPFYLIMYSCNISLYLIRKTHWRCMYMYVHKPTSFLACLF